MQLKIIFIVCCLFGLSSSLYADTLRINLKQAEEIFTEKNLSLLLQRFNVAEAKAREIQTALIDNPNLTVSDINPFKVPNNKLDGGFSNRPNQFSAELEQLITTAGKRRKSKQIARIETNIAESDFHFVFNQLKYQLRQTYYQMLLLSKHIDLLSDELNSLNRLKEAYKLMLDSEAVSKSEYLRIISLHNSANSELLDTKIDYIEAHNTMKIMLNIEQDIIIEDGLNYDALSEIQEYSADYLLELALGNRFDYQISLEEIELAEANYRLQRSVAVPDISIILGYDKLGGIYSDYFGVGISVDLPVFNRNKGNMAAADAIKQQNIIKKNMLEKEIEREVATAFQKYISTAEILENTDMNFLDEYDNIYEAVLSSFLSRNIGILEIIDFFESYKEAKMNHLNFIIRHFQAYEELRMAVGGKL